MFHPYAPTELYVAPKSNDDLRWTCRQCRTANNIAMPKCRRCIDGVKMDPPMLRVFFGQLPKDHTSEVLYWLLHLLCPTVAVFHIEAHTAKGGRGKGCAWVYVRTEDEAKQLVAMNHRAMLKISLTKSDEVGVYLGERASLVQLCDSEQAPSSSTETLRQLLVVELPMSAADKKEALARRTDKSSSSPSASSLSPSLGSPAVVSVWTHNPYGFCAIPPSFRLRGLKTS